MESPYFSFRIKLSTKFPLSFSSMIKKELQRLSNVTLFGLYNTRNGNNKAREALLKFNSILL